MSWQYYDHATKRRITRNGMTTTQVLVRGQWVEVGSYPVRPIPLPAGVKIVMKA